MWNGALTYFNRPLISGLMEDKGSSQLLPRSVCCICCFGSRTWRKSGRPQIPRSKRAWYLQPFQTTCPLWYQMQNTSRCFSKVSCMWNLKPHQRSFHSVPLKLVSSFCTLNGWLYWLLGNTDSLSYANFQILTDFMIKYQKLHSLIPLLNLIFKVLGSS